MFKRPHYSLVSSKGQTVIPAELRKILNIEKGSVLHFEILTTNTLIVRVMNDTPSQSSNKIHSIGLKKSF